MNARFLTLALVIAAATAGLSSCGGAPLSGPPELKLGRSECAECNMLISEDRCSCGLLVDDNGHREYLLYDDIGCMLDSERAGLDGRTVVERYVHDHTSKAWVVADQAAFVMVDPKALPTPMGSGIVAFASRANADAAAAKHAGKVLDYRALGEARRLWMEERYGRPDGASHPGRGG